MHVLVLYLCAVAVYAVIEDIVRRCAGEAMMTGEILLDDDISFPGAESLGD